MTLTIQITVVGKGTKAAKEELAFKVLDKIRKVRIESAGLKAVVAICNPPHNPRKQ